MKAPAGALACALVLASCSSPRAAATPDAQAAAAQQPAVARPAPDLDAQLAALEQRLAQAGDTGTAVGHLYEKKGDLLAGAGRRDEAIATYEQAARAYGQSPEATTEPVVRSERARAKAQKLRERR